MLNKPATAAEIETATATFKSATVSIGNGNTVLLQRSSMVLPTLLDRINWKNSF